MILELEVGGASVALVPCLVAYGSKYPPLPSYSSGCSVFFLAVVAAEGGSSDITRLEVRLGTSLKLISSSTVRTRSTDSYRLEGDGCGLRGPIDGSAGLLFSANLPSSSACMWLKMRLPDIEMRSESSNSCLYRYS